MRLRGRRRGSWGIALGGLFSFCLSFGGFVLFCGDGGGKVGETDQWVRPGMIFASMSFCMSGHCSPSSGGPLGRRSRR